jgi:hypothetical protein
MDIQQVNEFYRGGCFQIPSDYGSNATLLSRIGHGEAVLLSRVPPPPPELAAQKSRKRRHKKAKKIIQKTRKKHRKTRPKKASSKKLSSKTVNRVLDSLT